MICPVCRSQNMDTARFCGNCGNPFPRPSPPSSSFVNCAQGHTYAAIYANCPYCPQPESDASTDFETRIGEPITAVEPPLPPPPPPQYDFATRIDSSPLVFETRIDSSPPVFETRIDFEAATIETTPPRPVAPPAKFKPPASAPTEVMSYMDTTIADAPVIDLLAPPAEPPATPHQPSAPLPPESAPLPATGFPPAPPPPLPSSVPTEVRVVPPPIAAPPEPLDVDRRTTVVEGMTLPSTSKGKLIGWLVSYNRKPDGEDYRIYSGYNRIGANPVCDIVLEDETVSGSHAIIVYREGRCLVKDDLSRNGTFVNGREISEAHPLQNYDQIRIGNTYLTFVAAQRST